MAKERFGRGYRQLVEALQKADAAGDRQAAEHFADLIRRKQYDEEQSGGASLALGASQGATLGFADEAAAGARSLFGEFFDKTLGAGLYGLGIGVDTDENDDRGFFGRFKDYRANAENERSLGERYDQALESGRSAVETARREDPLLTIGGELAGGLATGGASMGRAAAGHGIRAGLARAAGTGALIGGAAGYGYSEGDPIATALKGGSGEEIAQEALEAGVGAATGGAVGAAAGFAIPALSAAARSVGRFLTKLTPTGKRYVLNEAGRMQVMDALEADLRSGNISLAQAQAEIRNTPGMVAADLGPALRDLTDRLAQSATQGGRVIREQLRQRAIDQYDRIMPALTDALGKPGSNGSRFASVSQSILNSAKSKATPLYQQAYAVPMTITRRMNQILKTPLGRVSRKNAVRLAHQLERKPLALGKNAIGKQVEMEDLDLILQSMDDHVTQLYSSGQPKLAGAAKKARDEFRTLLYRDNDTYKQARSVWAGHAKSNEALESGLKIFRDDADVTASLISGMSEGERTYFRVGVLRALERRLGNKADTADLVKGLADRRNVREALSVAFGNPEKFDQFMRLMAGEKAMFDTFAQAVGNSSTARRLMQANDAAMENLAALAGYGATLGAVPGLPPSIGGNLAKRAYIALRGNAPQRAFNQIADRQAGLLMTQNLENIMRPHTMGGLLSSGLPQIPTQLTGAGLLAGQGEASY